MSLHTTLVGTGRPNVLFLHGLFGQGRNWTNVAKGLEQQATSILFDLPDHGHSPWSDSFDYTAMADSIARDLRMRLGSAARITVVGHSMGGKVAMLMALRHPHLVKGLVVVDIAPDNSSHGYGFNKYVEAVQALPLDQVQTRADAERLMSEYVPDERVRAFLLQNLRRRKGHWEWQMNVPLLAEALPAISGFPESGKPYLGPVLWIRGAKSEYIRPEHYPTMMRLFPKTTLLNVEGAGHWVHTDAPDAVIAGLRNFLLAEHLDRPAPRT